MRTYWLLGEDEPERMIFPTVPPPGIRDFDVTPDLISNSSHKSINQTHRLSLQSIALRKRAKDSFHAESDQLLPMYDCRCQIHLQNNGRSSNEFIHIDDLERQKLVMECESCRRMYSQSTLMHGFPTNERRAREPRSAPQINFMQ